MLSSDRLNRAVVKLRSERPADWRDELESINSERKGASGRLHRLKYATISEVSALCVVLKEVGSLSNAEADYRERFWRRLALRRRLKLASDDCYGKPPNPACKCGGEAIDALADDELEPLNLMQARARVLGLAKERHQRAPQPRKLKPKAAAPFPSVSELKELLHVSPEAAPTPKPEPKTRHKGREPADPRSWRAFKDRQDGPRSAADLMDYEF
jgi:hypothetical protein